MKSKATLSLIEQVIMVLVFAIAAAVCLRVFVYADNLSKKQELTTKACMMAQTAAEEIKNTAGAVIESGYGFEQDGLVLTVDSGETESSLLGSATVTVKSGDEILISLPVRWQK